MAISVNKVEDIFWVDLWRGATHTSRPWFCPLPGPGVVSAAAALAYLLAPRSPATLSGAAMNDLTCGDSKHIKTLSPIKITKADKSAFPCYELKLSP